MRNFARLAWFGISAFCVGIVLAALIEFVVAEVRPTRSPTRSLTLNTTDVHMLITVHTSDDVHWRRTQLARYIWREADPSSVQPAMIQSSIHDDLYADISSLSHIDRLVIVMPYGFESVIYLLHPKRARDRLLIYHRGHDSDPFRDKSVITSLLEHDYHVAVVAMPLYEPNNRPAVDLPRFGLIHMTSHDQLRTLDTDQFSALRLFLEPVAATLNYIEQSYTFDLIAMIGVSGGGWTTTVYAAIDPRIHASYPVAGSLPLHLRSDGEWGDYEQALPVFHRIANYPELYVIGSYGRRQLQVLNRYDPCCFAGVRHQAYEKAVQERLAQLGDGSFGVYLDESHREHIISPTALRIILSDLDTLRR